MYKQIAISVLERGKRLHIIK